MFSLNLDNLKEILLLLGLFVLGWGFVSYQDVHFQAISERSALQSRIDSINMETVKTQYSRDVQDEKWQTVYAQLKKLEESDSSKSKTDYSTGSLIDIKRGKLIAEIEKFDSLSEIYNKTWNSDSLFTVYLNSQNEVINKKESESYYVYRRILILTGVLMFFLLPNILTDDYLKRKQFFSDLIRKGKVWLHCQSCGKNFSEIRTHGTNNDGTTNNSFCSTCFLNGTFTNTYATKQDVENEIYQTYNNTNPGFKKRVRNYVSSLQRWAGTSYSKIDKRETFKEPYLHETWYEEFISKINN